VIIDSSDFVEISVLFFIGRLLVYAEANPSIDSKVGGRRSVVNEIPVKIPIAAARSKLPTDKNDSARASMTGRRRRLANDGALEAVLKSLRIIAIHGS